jgi:cytochrome c2
MQGVKARTFDIEQVVINDLGKGGEVEWGKVDRCQTCHVAINREGFEAEANPFKTHPHRNEIFGSHPIAEFGCTTCHGGEGRATQIKGKPMGEGDFVHGFAKHWKHPLLRKEQVQSSCTKCHLDQWELPHADVSQKGKKLFWNLGCTGCHNVKGIQNPPKVGPSLENVASKVNQEWLMSWIKEPKSYLPHTKMPQAPLDILETGQIEKVAAYILDVSEEYKFPFGSYPGGSAALGAKTFEKVGCYGCHTLGERGTNLAPALDRIAEKTTASWIFNWIQDPQSYNAEARMPRLRRTSQPFL